MRAVIQRVTQANVSIGGTLRSQIGSGLLILLGVAPDDTPQDAEWLASKIARMRIFNDSKGIMNLSMLETGGQALVVSQFTLFASTKKGNRPGYSGAALPETAIPLYELFIQLLEKQLQKSVSTGEFGADMQVSLVNDGPVTILMDTHRKE